MKNKKTLKVLALALAIVLVVGIAVAGTVAYLTATTTAITNTFAVGEIKITLAETVTNDSFKIVPGATDPKDPTITVLEGSEKCYVYAYVENNITVDGTVVATPDINTTNWIVVATSGNKTLYRYKDIVDAADDDVALPVFTEVAYSGDIVSGDFAEGATLTIEVNAFAHQSDNVTQTVADDAAKAKFSLT